MYWLIDKYNVNRDSQKYLSLFSIEEVIQYYLNQSSWWRYKTPTSENNSSQLCLCIKWTQVKGLIEDDVWFYGFMERVFGGRKIGKRSRGR